MFANVQTLQPFFFLTWHADCRLWTLCFDSSLYHLDLHFWSQWCKKAKTSVPVISEISQSILRIFTMLFGVVGLMNLMFTFVIWLIFREGLSLDGFLKIKQSKQTDLHSDFRRPVSFTLCRTIDTTEFCGLTEVSVAVATGHSHIRKFQAIWIKVLIRWKFTYSCNILVCWRNCIFILHKSCSRGETSTQLNLKIQ